MSNSPHHDSADRETVDRDTGNFERSVNLPHATAETVARDLHAPGSRKPSSADVESERAARARGEAN